MAVDTSRPSYVRLGFWCLWIGLFIVAAYAARGTRTSGNAVYELKTFENGLVFYALWLAAALLIAVNRFDLLALRRPESWPRALGLAGLAIVAILACELIVAHIPLPQSPGKEQDLAPTHWQPAHAGVFAANFVLLGLIGPVVEELTFRGVGQSLLRFLGRAPSVVLIGVTFGLAHGLLEGLLVLIPFGIAVAWLRDRTDSVYPGMLVHIVFNSGTLALAVLAASG